MKKLQTFKLEPELIEALKNLAEKENRSFNNFIETELKNVINKKLKSIKNLPISWGNGQAIAGGHGQAKQFLEDEKKNEELKKGKP